MRHFKGERLGSAAEPVVADGAVFVATHQGGLYALDAGTGEPRWRYQARAAFLHAPAVFDGLVVAGSADGCLHAVDARTGKPRWTAFLSPGGFSASPTLADGAAFLGCRSGEFLAAELADGTVRWRDDRGAPFRQTAAYDDGRVYCTSEDLRVHCWDGRTGKRVWSATPLDGQTARDGYPVVVHTGECRFVVVRTNPVVNMARRLTEDRRFLCRQARVDDGDGKKLDAWMTGPDALGDADAWAREQDATARYLQDHPEARTFFVLDARTGRQEPPAPVLWCGGCQGAGAAPAALADGRLLVLYRSAYGNWNRGVAPLVALGMLDPAKGRITPLQHHSGKQPPWNTFWGAADESQELQVVSGAVLLVHQSTLGGYDLDSGRLFPIWGERDSWGGFRNLPWARSEWNGPARGGVAVAGRRLYWQTGSRVLCVAMGEQGKAAEDQEIDGSNIKAERGPAAPTPGTRDLQSRLTKTVREVLSRRWAPLYVEPGLAGREFFFADSADEFTALAWAYPHLPDEQRDKVRAYLANEWRDHPPCGKGAAHPLTEGERREWFAVPKSVLVRLDGDRPPHPFGDCYAVWLYAERCGEWDRVRADWPRLKAAFGDFVKTGWKLDGAKGDLFANRYLAALVAFAKVARKADDAESAGRAEAMAGATAESLAAWWRRAADGNATPVVPTIKEWDAFIGRGDALFFSVAPHRAKLALFHDLTPEVGALVRAKAPEAADKVWAAFETLCPTWRLQGEERQVHTGENYLDPPDFSLDAFRALAWLKGGEAGDLLRRLDVPCCRADLNYVMRLAVLSEGR